LTDQADLRAALRKQEIVIRDLLLKLSKETVRNSEKIKAGHKPRGKKRGD